MGTADAHGGMQRRRGDELRLASFDGLTNSLLHVGSENRSRSTDGRLAILRE